MDPRSLIGAGQLVAPTLADAQPRPGSRPATKEQPSDPRFSDLVATNDTAPAVKRISPQEAARDEWETDQAHDTEPADAPATALPAQPVAHELRASLAVGGGLQTNAAANHRTVPDHVARPATLEVPLRSNVLMRAKERAAMPILETNAEEAPARKLQGGSRAPAPIGGLRAVRHHLATVEWAGVRPADAVPNEMVPHERRLDTPGGRVSLAEPQPTGCSDHPSGARANKMQVSLDRLRASPVTGASGSEPEHEIVQVEVAIPTSPTRSSADRQDPATEFGHRAAAQVGPLKAEAKTEAGSSIGDPFDGLVTLLARTIDTANRQHLVSVGEVAGQTPIPTAGPSVLDVEIASDARLTVTFVFSDDRLMLRVTTDKVELAERLSREEVALKEELAALGHGKIEFGIEVRTSSESPSGGPTTDHPGRRSSSGESASSNRSDARNGQDTRPPHSSAQDEDRPSRPGHYV